MKYLLFLTFILNLQLLASSKVILGSYSSQESANKVKMRLDSVINNDEKFKKFLLKNNIQSLVTQEQQYFRVTLEPINDIVTQHAIINRVKKSNFQDAYALNIIPKTTLEKVKEVEVTDLEVKAPNKHMKPLRKNTTSYPTHTKSLNLLDKYFHEFIASITILLLSIIYLSIKRKQHFSNEFLSENARELPSYNDEQTTLQKSTQEQPTTKEDEEQTEEIYTLKEEGAIDFEILSSEQKTSDSNPKSKTLKRDSPRHKNTTKADFKDFAGVRIMIAEDNIINQKVISGLLVDSEIEIVIAEDGQKALDILTQDNNFSIIFMDAHMPNVDGYEATKIIRANPTYDHITIIALTGDTASDDIKKMQKVGMQGHLEKPLKMDPLYDALSDYSFRKEKISIEHELDSDKGFVSCGSDTEFYKEILNDFIKNYSDSNKYIKELLHLKHYDAVQNLLLDISSLSSNIGAKTVGKFASELRVALDSPQEDQYLVLFENYAKHFDALEKEVKQYLLTS